MEVMSSCWSPCDSADQESSTVVADACDSSSPAVTKPLDSVGGTVGGTGAGSSELDRSNTLMTPQELERMPDQGLEFEQSVGPKELPKLTLTSATQNTGEDETSISSVSPTLTDDSLATLSQADAPIVLSQKGDELTTITVLTSQGEKVHQVQFRCYTFVPTILCVVVFSDYNLT